MLEHKGLYWSKVPGTEDARAIEAIKRLYTSLSEKQMLS
jgi:hypothetical protein